MRTFRRGAYHGLTIAAGGRVVRNDTCGLNEGAMQLVRETRVIDRAGSPGIRDQRRDRGDCVNADRRRSSESAGY